MFLCAESISWPDFWWRARVFGSTAETHHLPPRNHLDLDVGGRRRRRGDGFQRLCRTGNECDSRGGGEVRQRSGGGSGFCLKVPAAALDRSLAVWTCWLTVAEVAALRTVLLHERLPALAEAEASPRVTHSLLIQAACTHTQAHTHRFNMSSKQTWGHRVGNGCHGDHAGATQYRPEPISRYFLATSWYTIL